MKNKQKVSSDKFTMMTQMPVNKLICKMAVPTIITMLVSAVYNMADTYFVGKIGTSATGAVGVVFSFMAIIQACGFFFGHGSGNYMSRKLGEQKTEEASVMASTGFFSSFAVGVIIGVLGLIFISPLSKLLGSTDTILPYTKQYLFYILCGTPFMMSSLVLNNQLRFQGSAVNGMIGVTAGGVLNILLDPIFIFVFNMGVRGAALATVLSQAVGAVWILHFLTGNKTILRLKKANLRLDAKIIGPCLALGISTFVMLSTESILSISFTSSLSRYGGDLAVGAMTIITSTNQLIVMPLQGICQGGQPIISYNYGAKNNDRVKKAFFTQFKVCVIFTCISWAIMMLAPQLFAGIFTSDKVLANYTAWALRIYMAGIFAMGFQVSCQQSFMALGQAKVSLILACLRKLILLIPLIFILPLIFQDKVFAVFLAEPVSDIIAAIVTTIVFMFKFNNILSENE